jgi:hypothetical protein
MKLVINKPEIELSFDENDEDISLNIITRMVPNDHLTTISLTPKEVHLICGFLMAVNDIKQAREMDKSR